MSFAAQGLSALQEGSTRRAMSPFAVFNSLQHACSTHSRSAVGCCRRQLGQAELHSSFRRERQKASLHAANTTPWLRHAHTTCRAQAVVADPAVTGKPQQEASPYPASSNGTPKSSAYPFSDIEAKWQGYWSTNKTFRTPDIANLDKSKPKFYALDMFPYPRSLALASNDVGVAHK